MRRPCATVAARRVKVQFNSRAEQDWDCPLFSRFYSVVVLTQHLAVLRVGLAALVPGVDVIAFHLVQRELLLALDADSLPDIV